MALPMVMLAVAASASVAGGGLRMAGAAESYQSSRRDLRVQAAEARTQGAEEMLNLERDVRSTLSSQAAAAAASGIDPYSSPSTRAIADDTMSVYERMARGIRLNTQTELLGIERRRKNLKRRMFIEQTAAVTDTVADLAMGGMRGAEAGVFG